MYKKAAIITAFNPYHFKGGIETYIIQLIALLRDHKIDVDLYTLDLIKNDTNLFNGFAEKIYFLGRKFAESDIGYDIVIANSFYGAGYFPPRARAFNIYHSCHAAFADAIKDVVSENTYFELRYLYGELLESVSGYDRTLLSVSENVADELRRYYGLSDIKVINSCVNTNIFKKFDKQEARKKLFIPEDAYVALYVGRWDKTKGCDIMEEVMTSRLLQDIYWVIVLGTGTDKNLLPKIHNMRIFEEIEHDRVVEFYNAADFVLFPSRYESFGYVIAEALACEVPVITTNVGVAQAIYKDYPLKMLLLPAVSDNSGAIADLCIEKILLTKEDIELRKALGSEGRSVIEKNYSLAKWHVQMAKALGIYI